MTSYKLDDIAGLSLNDFLHWGLEVRELDVVYRLAKGFSEMAKGAKKK